MPELSVDEERYLLAAFSAIPQDWFRPQTVGRQLALSDEQSDSITLSLAAAGMLIANPGCHARLTGPGRSQAAKLITLNQRPQHGRDKINPRIMAAAWLVAMAGAVLALLWFEDVF